MKDFSESNILAIDSSSRNLKLGLSYGGDRLVQSDESVGQEHGQVIVKKISELFQSAGISKDDLEAICVCTGPGSFTGLRIGLSAAKGMAVALGVDVVGVSLFEVAAFKLRAENDPVSVIIPLKRDEFFVGEVSGGEFVSDEIRVVTEQGLADAVGQNAVAGFQFSLSERFPQVENPDLSSDVEYNAGDLIYLGRDRLSRGLIGDLSELEPLYVQKSQAEIRFEQRNRS